MAATIDYVSDWQTRLRSRIYEQFNGLPNITAWSDMIARQTQDLEDAFQAVLTITSLDDSSGAQLDNLGRLLGQARNGVSDVVYVMYLRAAILLRRSKGTPEDIYKVIGALLGSPTMLIRSGGTKSFFLRVSTPLTRVQALAGAQFLLGAKEAGARADFIWQEDVSANMFAMDAGGKGFDQGEFAGAIGV